MPAFLKTNHNHLVLSELLSQMLNGGLKIPDLVTFDPPQRTEFYEIKPDSGSGRQAGFEKIARIDAFMHYHHLPYVPGTQYSPDRKKIRFFSGAALGIEVDLFLEFTRVAPALILYKVCVRGKHLKEAAVLLAIAAIILLLITRGRILPRGSPIPLPVPGFA